MTDWFARPVLHVTDVEASLRFYVDRVGFTSPWRYDEDGRVRVAQVDRQGCALILADTWPEKIGKGLMFISLNVEPEAQIAALDRLRAELEAKDVPVVSVIDPPGIPERKSFPPRILLALLLTFLSFACASTIILLRTHWATIDRSDPRKALATEILSVARLRLRSIPAFKRGIA